MALLNFIHANPSAWIYWTKALFLFLNFYNDSFRYVDVSSVFGAFARRARRDRSRRAASPAAWKRKVSGTAAEEDFRRPFEEQPPDCG